MSKKPVHRLSASVSRGYCRSFARLLHALVIVSICLSNLAYFPASAAGAQPAAVRQEAQLTPEAIMTADEMALMGLADEAEEQTPTPTLEITHTVEADLAAAGLLTPTITVTATLPPPPEHFADRCPDHHTHGDH